MLHRDLKPSNVFVDRRNLCRLGDYGIASFASDAGSVRGVLGTPLYLAPELIEGRMCNEMADMWALGVLLYEVRAARGAAPRIALAPTSAVGSAPPPPPPLASSSH